MSLSVPVSVAMNNLEVLSVSLCELSPPRRCRSLSVSDCSSDVFCQLELSVPALCLTPLPQLFSRVQVAIKAGVAPIRADDGAMGGTYFLRDASLKPCFVFKPADEEPFAPNNPFRSARGRGHFCSAYRGGIYPGFGMYREVVAFVLDCAAGAWAAGVPVTQLAKIRHPVFVDSPLSLSLSPSRDTHTAARRADYKIGSVQQFVAEIECSAEDMGPSLFDDGDVCRLAMLDIRICNLDRHAGNILVCRAKENLASSLSLSISSLAQPLSGEDCINESLSVISLSQALSVPSLSQPTGPKLASSCPSESLFLNKDLPMRIETSPRAIDSSPSPNGREVSRKHRLVPIDHGYSLPHLLHLSQTNFAWLNWPQCSKPLDEAALAFIASLDAEAEVRAIKRLVGAAIPETSLLTLQVCTLLLQMGAQAGLTLRQIAVAMSAADAEMSSPSPLQTAVNLSILDVLSCGVEARQRKNLNVFDASNRRNAMEILLTRIDRKDSFEADDIECARRFLKPSRGIEDISPFDKDKAEGDFFRGEVTDAALQWAISMSGEGGMNFLDAVRRRLASLVASIASSP